MPRARSKTFTFCLYSLIGHFKKHKPLISEECYSNLRLSLSVDGGVHFFLTQTYSTNLSNKDTKQTLKNIHGMHIYAQYSAIFTLEVLEYIFIYA